MPRELMQVPFWTPVSAQPKTTLYLQYAGAKIGSPLSTPTTYYGDLFNWKNEESQ
ncbi:hypothetical protein [Reinekea sp. G2M2-21]|uniref:hypothetical protein n=1 Tax=Reinekea sp. G2M2-21 TaxID=2788942 RepID=UPI0018AAEB0F|nr:hypothetical protein [Reinekea sp. G2M2-21]